MKAERLLQSQGFGTRKECRLRVLNGALSITGTVIDDPGAEISLAEGQPFCVDGETWPYRTQVYIALHKPAGYECSRQPFAHPSVFALLPPQFAQRNVQPVGRLDQDTTGLLLLSDDGQFIHRWSSGKKKVPKEYRVTTSEPIDADMVARLLDGVSLHDEPTPLCALDCVAYGRHTLHLTLGEGKYHQVKRMVAAAGGHVAALHRLRVGGFCLPDELVERQWCWLEEPHLTRLADF